MPAVSKKQQRLFGWALACKRGSSKNCPPAVKKLADQMPEGELEKFAKTSHEGLPMKVKESLDAVLNATVELLEAQLEIDLDTYDFELSENELSEAKTIKVDQPDGKPLSKGKDAEKTKKLSDAKEEKVPANKEIKDAKDEVEEKKNEVPMPKGKEVPEAKTEPAASKESNVEKNDPPSVDNDTDEKDESWDKPQPGMQEAKKSPMGNIYTPSVHKFPMSTNPKNERRVYDFDGFLKIINYKTHDGVEQKGHGQNLRGDAGMA
jgi:hypothetical protein